MLGGGLVWCMRAHCRGKAGGGGGGAGGTSGGATSEPKHKSRPSTLKARTTYSSLADQLPSERHEQQVELGALDRIVREEKLKGAEDVKNTEIQEESFAAGHGRVHGKI